MPLYVNEMGPSLTLTVPANVSPSYSVRVAPGKHGAIVSGVFSASHAFSIGASMVNVFSSCMGSPRKQKADARPG